MTCGVAAGQRDRKREENSGDPASLSDRVEEWRKEHGKVSNIQRTEISEGKVESKWHFEDGTVKRIVYENLGKGEVKITHQGLEEKVTVGERVSTQEQGIRWGSPSISHYDFDVKETLSPGESTSENYLPGDNSWKDQLYSPTSEVHSRANGTTREVQASSETSVAGWVNAGADVWKDIEVTSGSSDTLLEVNFDWRARSGLSAMAGAGGATIHTKLYDKKKDKVVDTVDMRTVESHESSFDWDPTTTKTGNDSMFANVDSGRKFRIALRVETAAFSAGTSWTTADAGGIAEGSEGGKITSPLDITVHD